MLFSYRSYFIARLLLLFFHRHPYVLTFVDSTEMDDSLLLVTEPCIPLDQWLKKLSSNADPSIPKQNIFHELTWGFKCILQALDFVHSQCNIVHGNVSPSSIFITPSGDWKLAGFEFSSSVNTDEDISSFRRFQHLLDSSYVSPERKDTDNSKLRLHTPPFYLDIFSYGKCIEYAFAASKEEIEGPFGKYVSLMVHHEAKKRPTAKKLLTAKSYNSDYIKIMENIQEFNIKGPKEILEVMAQLDSLLPQMTVALCSYKLLPNLCRVLQRAINDFQVRDSRETARQSIIAATEMLSKLASLQKLEQTAFETHYRELIIQLWGMSDRSIRTVLLSTLKNIVDFIPESAVNKSIFDHMIAGFADSNSKMRESTLMSLIYIVDKLDEVHMQDRLVRCVLNLQNDPEASIRTNTMIFIGKIAHRLKEAVKQRVLCSALVKAMKDNFVHCRIAALKTSMAVGKLLDVPQIAGKLMPQASVLCLDKHPEVRSLSIALLENSIEMIKNYHIRLAEEKQQSKDDLASPQSNAGGSMDYLNTSWSLLQSVTKSVATPAPTAASMSVTTPLKETKEDKFMPPSTPPSSNIRSLKSSTTIGGAVSKKSIVEDDDDMDFDQPVDDASSKLSNMDLGGDDTWGDDDLDDILKGGDLADDLDSSRFHGKSMLSLSNISTPESASYTKKIQPVVAPSAPNPVIKSTSISALSKSKPVKAAVKKLEVKKDEWDDF
ncbi:hypothetical protein EON65_30820 [archaeon]|nr:MAG: hypothetical protein EON65_30820 [archaeon]